MEELWESSYSVWEGVKHALCNPKWRWSRNTKCKYVTIRIDMRDGMCLLMDRDGERISLEELAFQYKGKGDEE